MKRERGRGEAVRRHKVSMIRPERVKKTRTEKRWKCYYNNFSSPRLFLSSQNSTEMLNDS